VVPFLFRHSHRECGRDLLEVFQKPLKMCHCISSGLAWSRKKIQILRVIRASINSFACDSKHHVWFMSFAGKGRGLMVSWEVFWRGEGLAAASRLKIGKREIYWH
jgi:hypothetical protein